MKKVLAAVAVWWWSVSCRCRSCWVVCRQADLEGLGLGRVLQGELRYGVWIQQCNGRIGGEDWSDTAMQRGEVWGRIGPVGADSCRFDNAILVVKKGAA